MFLSDTSIKRPIFTTMVIAALTIFGFISMRTIGVDLYPRVEFPVVVVVSVLPGADPETVEKTVSKPIEDALSTISSIKRLRSTSGESVSQVVLEFELEKNVDIAFQEVQAKLGTVRSELPQDLEDPVVEKFDIDSSPMMAVVLSGKLPIQKLSTIADTLVKTRLQQVKNVGEVRLIGKRERTIWIHLDPSRLEGYFLSVPEVIAALKNHHIEVPGGRVETGLKEYVVKTKAEFSHADEFKNLLIGYREGYPIILSDIGEVQDGLEEERSSASLDGEKAISLLIRKQSGTNTVEVAQAVKVAVKKLQEELGAQGISLNIAQDFSLHIERSIHNIQFHLIFGGALAVLIVFLFLHNARMTIISALAIPISVISAFLFMSMLGFTMNQMTMLALSLAIGILIDDAIVVVENIYRHYKKGKKAQDAAQFGAQEIGLAAFAITMSIVAVFLPVACMKGIIGRFFYQFGVTVTVAVLMSLFVAFTLVPMLASKFLKKEEGKSKLLEQALGRIEAWYLILLKGALQNKKTVLLVACAALVCSFYSVKFLKSEFIPTVDQSEFFIKVTTPLGSSLPFTEDVITKIRKQIENEPWVEYVFATIGSGNMKRVNEAVIYVKMIEKARRSISQMQAMGDVRQRLSTLKDTKLSIEPVPAISSGAIRHCALQINVAGSDLEKLETIVRGIVGELKKREGYVDLDTSYEKDSPELIVKVKRDAAAALQVTPATIGQTIRAMIGGITLSTFTEEGERYDINLRAKENMRDSLDSILRLSVKNAQGDLIPLESVVEVSHNKGPVQIDRMNRERTITIFVNLRESKTLGEAVKEVKGIIEESNLPLGYHTTFTGMADTMGESFGYLLFALILAVIIVYMVLASQFESFTQPFVIMLSLPFSLIGALSAMLVTASTLNINTIIGIIMLMGLVTKNAILLVDYANTLRSRDGKGLYDALLEAGATRLHPILMTTGAMIFGMLPIALSHGAGSEADAPMAIAIIGGLLTSTFLTLIVVPVVYSIMGGEKERCSCEG
jgi:hydrophobic/amphiphilic exporter-1 (mainly G- bacteria), HAE1 family